MNANESEARISNVIWAYINNHDHEGLENHLEMTKNKIDITRLYNLFFPKIKSQLKEGNGNL